ncbi:MAG: sulfotransferase [Phycisphaerae bacterium]|nr:sulfotransferase [Phycisphaerae bacterium]
MPRPPLPAWYQDAFAAARVVADRTVFFVVGCQKSGTSWVSRLAGSHPAVACRGEGHYTDELAPHLETALERYNEASKVTTPMSFEDLLSVIRLVIDRRLAQLVTEGGRADDIRAVGDKTPEAALAIPHLATLYPAARFVHVIRDGRDGAVSGWAHLERTGATGRYPSFAAYVADFARHHWRRYIETARRDGASRPDHYLELRYEDLHRDPLPTARRLFAFLGVAADETVTSHCLEQASFRRLTGRLPGEEARDAHLRKGVVGDWPEAFDTEARVAFEREAGALLATLGYAGPEAIAA